MAAELNAKYATENYTPFFLFHRPRLWNAQEGIWMGHERKRGKIEELNNSYVAEPRVSFRLLKVTGQFFRVFATL